MPSQSVLEEILTADQMAILERANFELYQNVPIATVEATVNVGSSSGSTTDMA